MGRLEKFEGRAIYSLNLLLFPGGSNITEGGYGTFPDSHRLMETGFGGR